MTAAEFDYWYKGVVTEIYDGDSITIEMDLGCRTWRKDQKIRLLDLNAPEIRGEERPLGIISRDALIQKLPLGASIILNTYKDKDDKYGRLLALVFLEGENVNEWMVLNGYAKHHIY